MQLIAYGEDALTLYALVRKLPDVLRTLNDRTDPDEATIIFRPSFGRRGGGADIGHSPQFGEFDAILGTAAATYLIESKWHRSSEVQNGAIILREGQRYRHRVMRWYIDQWRLRKPANWTEFARAVESQTRFDQPRVKLPPGDSLLAANLEFFLQRISGAGQTIRDVVLFICAPGLTAPRSVAPDGFELVCLQYDSVGGAGYLEITL